VSTAAHSKSRSDSTPSAAQIHTLLSRLHVATSRPPDEEGKGERCQKAITGVPMGSNMTRRLADNTLYAGMKLTEWSWTTALQKTPSGPTDWLWHPRTPVCRGELRGDIDDRDPAFKVLVVALFTALLVCVGCLHMRWRWRSHKGQIQEGVPDDLVATSQQKKAPRKRLWHLDHGRIICVVAVVIDHTGGSSVTASNLGWCLQWVQQWLVLISGMGFMMSRSPLWAYVLKMLVVTAIGMGANWLGIIMAGGLRSGFSEVCVPSDCVKYIDPAKNQGVTDYDTLSTSRLLDAIVFQMGYTLFLAAMAVIVVHWPAQHATH
jgi:hypothetical protein